MSVIGVDFGTGNCLLAQVSLATALSPRCCCHSWRVSLLPVYGCFGGYAGLQAKRGGVDIVLNEGSNRLNPYVTL